jgi:hypothetical protein
MLNEHMPGIHFGNAPETRLGWWGRAAPYGYVRVRFFRNQRQLETKMGVTLSLHGRVWGGAAWWITEGSLQKRPHKRADTIKTFP